MCRRCLVDFVASFDKYYHPTQNVYLLLLVAFSLQFHKHHVCLMFPSVLKNHLCYCSEGAELLGEDRWSMPLCHRTGWKWRPLCLSADETLWHRNRVCVSVCVCGSVCPVSSSCCTSAHLFISLTAHFSLFSSFTHFFYLFQLVYSCIILFWQPTSVK